MILSLSLIILCAAIFMIFASEFHGLSEKLFAVPLVKNSLLLIAASILIIYFQKEIAEILTLFLNFMQFLVDEIIVQFNLSGWWITFCYILALLIIPTIPAFIFAGAYKLVRKQDFKYAMTIAWCIWIVLVCIWLRR